MRLDWAGTESFIAGTIVAPDAAGTYDTAVGLAFESGKESNVAYSPVTRIDVPAP